MTIFILYTILYVITSIGIFTIAALVYTRQHSRENRAFSLFTTFLGLWIFLQFVAQSTYQITPVLAELAFRVALAFPAFFAVEFYDFVKRYVRQLSQDDSLPWQVYVMPVLFAVAALVPGGLYSSVTLNYAGIALSGNFLYYLLILYAAVYIGDGIWRLIRHLLRSKQNHAAEYRTRLLLGGIAIATLTIFGAIIFFPDDLLSQLTAPIAVLAMVSFIGYAIIKHRLFDIRLIAIRLLAYLLSLATVAALYTLLAFGLFANLLKIDHITAGQELSFVVVAMVLALTFAPLKRFFDKATRAVFYQDAYQPQQVIDDIGTVLVRRVEVRALIRESLNILRTALKSEYVTVILLDPKTGNVERAVGVGRTPKIDAAYPVILRHGSPLLVTDEIESQDATTYRTLQRSNVSVVAHLKTSHELIGYVVYGYKANGRIYSVDDVNLIRLTADELAVAVQNALRFEEITRFNETLQEEVRQATADLRETNKKLRSLDEAKDEFISMASHQLRTPLTSVKGYISMVLEGDAGKLNPTQKQLLLQAFASSQRMVYLISDFLNVSRLQTGKFVIERIPTDLSRVVRQELDQLQATAASRELKLEYTAPSSFPILQLDESKLRQVVMNFVDNAIFYSHPGGTIKIDLTKTAKEIIFTVQDQGIGVPPSERHHLFTKFYRASNARAARPDGTGVGLFMAKKVIVEHGGAIIFNSVEGKGSTFGFRMPLHAVLENHPKELKQEPANK